SRLAGHSRVVVGQVEDSARRLDRNRVSRIQAEEPYARLPLCAHICPDVELRERGEIRHWWDRTRPDLTHTKRYNANPCAAIECVDLQPRRDIPTQCVAVDRPMHKQQV